MAKGDRELFKADTDDGYTKIANLLLEALAMAKLNGVQKGICLFLWRRTYGWGIKEDQITLKEFAQACDTSESYISRQIKQLVKWNIIIRSSYEPGKVPTYTFNTRVAEWDKGCINVQGLNEREIQGLYKCAIQGLHDCARVNQASAQENQGPEPSLKKEERNIKEIDPPTPTNNNTRTRDTNLIQKFQQEFGRPLSPTEIEQIQAWERDMPAELVVEALKRAVLAGKFNFKYIDRILLDWQKNNIRTLQEVKHQDREFERLKMVKEVKIRGPTGQDIRRNGGENSPGQGKKGKKKYAGLIPTIGGQV